MVEKEVRATRQGVSRAALVPSGIRSILRSRLGIGTWYFAVVLAGLLLIELLHGKFALGVAALIGVLISLGRSMALTYRIESESVQEPSIFTALGVVIAGAGLLVLPTLLIGDRGLTVGAVGFIVVLLLLIVRQPRRLPATSGAAVPNHDGRPFIGVFLSLLVLAITGAAIAFLASRVLGRLAELLLLASVALALLAASELLEIFRLRSPSTRTLIAWSAVCVVPFTTGMFAWFLARAFTPVSGGLIALGIVLGPIPIGLLSQKSFFTKWNTRTQLAGLALMFVGGFLLLRKTSKPQLAIVFAAALIVLVWSLASNSNVDVLLFVALIGLSVGSLPDTATAPVSTDATTFSHRPLVALGDSWISGEGGRTFEPGTNTRRTNKQLENQCRRSIRAYPRLIAVARKTDLVFVACSGALGRNLTTEGQYPGEPPTGSKTIRDRLPSQLSIVKTRLSARLSSDKPEWILVSVGGNDAGFALIGQACLAPGNCSELDAVWQTFIDSMSTTVGTTFNELHRSFPTSKIMVVPYALPLAMRSCSRSPFSEREHRYLRDIVGRINKSIRAQAGRFDNFYFAEAVEGTFAETGQICAKSDPRTWAINLVAFHPTGGSLIDQFNPVAWIHNSVHPNDAGHRLLAKRVQRDLDAPMCASQSSTATGCNAVATPSAPIVAPSCRRRACNTRIHQWIARSFQLALQRHALALVLLFVGAWITHYRPTRRLRDLLFRLVPR